MPRMSSFVRQLFHRSRESGDQEGYREQGGHDLPGNTASPTAALAHSALVASTETNGSSRPPPRSNPIDALQQVPATSTTPPPPQATPEASTAETNAAAEDADPISGSLPQQLWDRAYEDLKQEDPALVNAYEKILSSQLQNGIGSRVLESQSNNIDQHNFDERRRQMGRLVRNGLDKTAREARAKERIGVAMDVVQSAKDLISSAVQTMPQVTLAWASVTVGLEMLVNPLKQTEANRNGIKYVIGRMSWYCNLSTCLLKQSNDDKHELSAIRYVLENQIIDIYKALLSYQMKSVYSYYRHRGLVFLRDIVKLDDWQGDLTAIRYAENRLQGDTDVYGVQQMNSHLEQMSSYFAQLVTNQTVEETVRIEKAYSEILSTLSYPEMFDREEEMPSAHQKTFEWLLQVDQNRPDNVLIDWLRSPGSLFWLTGKAGSGKSTLMKLLYRDPRLHEYLLNWAPQDKLTMAIFYFYDLGVSRLQKSLGGFLRSILYQVLKQHQELIPVVFAEEYRRSLYRERQDGLMLNLYRLKAAFQFLLKECGTGIKLFLCIDGLDEYRRLSTSAADMTCADGRARDKEQQVRCTNEDHDEIAHLIRAASSVPGVKMCVASRSLTTFMDAFATCPTLPLHEVTANDIGTYVQHNLNSCEQIRAKILGCENLSTVLTREIVSKASGVFLWVKLVVERALNLARNGGTLEEIQTIVRFSPSDITGRGGLYDRMLRDVDPECRPIGDRIFRLVRSSDVPLSALQLRFAEDGRRRVFEESIKIMSEDEIETARDQTTRRLKSMCAGLLELRPSDGHMRYAQQDQAKTVGFIHKTASDFISDYWSATLGTPEDISFNPQEALLAGYVARLKHAPHASGELPIAQSVIEALRCARSAEALTSGSQVDLLDELDDTMTSITSELFEDIQTPENRCDRHSIHWVSRLLFGNTEMYPSSSEEDFMSLAVEASLTKYIRHKLGANIYSLKEKKGRPLLAFAVFHDQSTHFPEPSDPDTVKLLLGNGADPNQVYNGRTPWQLALQWAYNSKAIQRGAFTWCNSLEGKKWTENTQILVSAGADVNVWLWIRVSKGRNTKSPLFIIIDILRGNPEVRDKLALDMKTRGARLYCGEKDQIRWTYALQGEGHPGIEVVSREEARRREINDYGKISLAEPYVVMETKEAAFQYARRLEKLLEQLPEDELSPKQEA